MNHMSGKVEILYSSAILPGFLFAQNFYAQNLDFIHKKCIIIKL